MGPKASSNGLKVFVTLCRQRSAEGQWSSEGGGDSATLVVRPAAALPCEHFNPKSGEDGQALRPKYVDEKISTCAN